MNFSLNPSYDLIIVIFLLSTITIFFSYKLFYEKSGYKFLILLRLFLIILIILLFFDPTIILKREREKSFFWHIYIDKSLSLNYYKQPSKSSYINSLSNFINRLKNKNINYEAYSFGSDIHKISDINSIEIDDNSTNIGSVFENMDSEYKNDVVGGIIFTDGQINQGPLLSRFDDFSKVPINIIGVGDTIPMLDVSVKSVDIPPLSVKGEEVNIDVIISSVGNLKERVNVTLFDEKNKLIGSKILKVFGQESEENVRFQIKPNQIGENNYLIKCSALSDEINIDNNSQRFSLQVMKDQYNIALITGSPNYNTRLIKDHLLSGKNNNVDHFVYVGNQFRPQLNEFWEKKYEVIIFDNNPVMNNKNSWEALLRVFTKKLISHNSSFFIIPGPETSFNSMDKFLKIIDIEAEKFESENKNKYNWNFTKLWFDNFTFNDSKTFFENFSALPPQYPAFQLIDNSSNNKITYAEYLDVDKSNPILILAEKKSIRYALWNSKDIASIQSNLMNTKNSYLIDNSLSKIFNWLMKKSGSQEFIFRSNKNSYQQGEEVILSGKSLDFNNENIHEGTIELFYDGKFIGSKPMYLDIKKNEYKSRFWAPKPGLIEYVVKINKGLESYEVSSGIFEVQQSHIELNRIFLNKEKLKNIAINSGGNFKLWKNHEELIDEISNVSIREKYTQKYKIRYNYLYIMIIFFTLALEWFLRRRMGLI